MKHLLLNILEPAHWKVSLFANIMKSKYLVSVINVYNILVIQYKWSCLRVCIYILCLKKIWTATINMT